MSDSEDDEAEAAEFMSKPEINDFLEEAEEEKEQLAGRSGRHWKPMVFEEVFEVAETTHFPSGFLPRTRTIPQERFLRPAAVFDTVYGEICMISRSTTNNLCAFLLQPGIAGKQKTQITTFGSPSGALSCSRQARYVNDEIILSPETKNGENLACFQVNSSSLDLV